MPWATLPKFCVLLSNLRSQPFSNCKLHCNCLGHKHAFPETTSTAEWKLFFLYILLRNHFHLCFTVLQIVNITMAAPKYQDQRLVRQPVDITFTVRVPRGYLMGSEVSTALMRLTTVEFSYYMGFPVLQIAEREYYKIISL